MGTSADTSVAINNQFGIDELDIVRLDHHSFKEAKSILYQAYLNQPTFQYLLGHGKPGYDQRVRATLRELMELHFSRGQDVIGITVNELLVAVAFIGSPNVRLRLTDQISWRMRMTLTAGLSCTRRYIDFYEQISELHPTDYHHELPLIGVHPKYQSQGVGTALLKAVEQICAENHKSTGISLDTGSARCADYYCSLGYERVGEIQIGPVTETVLFKPIRKLVRQ
ncbi:MAG: GNAT family N-acetyltransferase [Proteobacteria bacterium]|nr:MAG: GNAT family N-acetyltransferase [Pseudomonadota bacterium]